MPFVHLLCGLPFQQWPGSVVAVETHVAGTPKYLLSGPAGEKFVSGRLNPWFYFSLPIMCEAGSDGFHHPTDEKA